MKTKKGKKMVVYAFGWQVGLIVTGLISQFYLFPGLKWGLVCGIGFTLIGTGVGLGKLRNAMKVEAEELAKQKND